MPSTFLIAHLHLMLALTTLWFGAQSAPLAAFDAAGGSGYTVVSDEMSRGFSFALLDDGEHDLLAGEWDATARSLERARDLVRADHRAVLYVRTGREAYVVRDAALVRQAKDACAAMIELGRRQGDLGRRQGELGSAQGRLGVEQGRLGARQGEIAAKLAALETRLALSGGEDGNLEAQISRLRSELDDLQQDVTRRQSELAQRQEPLARQQSELGRRQEELGRQQERASRDASLAVQRIFEEALRSAKAERLE